MDEAHHCPGSLSSRGQPIITWTNSHLTPPLLSGHAGVLPIDHPRSGSDHPRQTRPAEAPLSRSAAFRIGRVVGPGVRPYRGAISRRTRRGSQPRHEAGRSRQERSPGGRGRSRGTRSWQRWPNSRCAACSTCTTQIERTMRHAGSRSRPSSDPHPSERRGGARRALACPPPRPEPSEPPLFRRGLQAPRGNAPATAASDRLTEDRRSAGTGWCRLGRADR